MWGAFFSYVGLAAGAAATVVVISAAANEDDDEQDDPGAATVTEKVVSTHERFLLFSDFTIYYVFYEKMVTMQINKYFNEEKPRKT